MPSAHRSPLNWLLGHPWHLLAAIGTVIFVIWAVGTRSQGHHVTAQFDSAFNLVSGLVVSVDGQEVGKISEVKYENGKGLVKIGIDDDQFWPLHAGTKVISRWGTSIGSGTRRLDLVPGPTTAPALPEGGIIPTADTQPAVDIDQILNSFSKRQRTKLRSLQSGMHATLSGHERQLNEALHTASGGLDAAGDVMADLGRDTAVLRSFVTNTHRATETLAARSAAIKGLLTVAAQTFQTFANNTQATQDTIQELSPALGQARTTLARVDSSVGKLDTMVAALAPGAKRLTPLARTAQPALAAARDTLPATRDTVVSLTKAAPDITGMLRAATPFMKLGPSVFGDLAPMWACIRPYAPEIAGTIVGGSAWIQTYELMQSREAPEAAALNLPTRWVQRRGPGGLVKQHSASATPVVSSASFDNQVLNPKQYTDLFGKQYAGVRPPGLTEGQPWFLPECNITSAGLDPAKDAETRP